MRVPASLRWLASHPETRRRPWRTGSRWIYWQLRQRFTKREKVMDFFRGTRLAIYPGEGLTGYWYVKRPEFAEMTFLERYLRKGDVFYDIGANAGAYAVFAAGAGCQVHAFEPVPAAFGRLLENASLNQNTTVIEAHQTALGEAEGTIRMSAGLGTGNHVIVSGEADIDSVEVRITTLDRFRDFHAMPNFLKIDVEGHELAVVRGGRKCLEDPGVSGLLIETFRPHNWQRPQLIELEGLLASLGFSAHAFDPVKNELTALDAPWAGSENTIYLRNGDKARRRLEEWKEFECNRQ